MIAKVLPKGRIVWLPSKSPTQHHSPGRTDRFVSVDVPLLRALVPTSKGPPAFRWRATFWQHGKVLHQVDLQPSDADDVAQTMAVAMYEPKQRQQLISLWDEGLSVVIAEATAMKRS